MTPQVQNLAQAIHTAQGHPGPSCEQCKIVAQSVESFGAGITVDGRPVQIPPGGPCHVCQRAALPGLNYVGKLLCAECAPYPHAGLLMIEFTQTEEAAIEVGGQAAGQYLDKVGKTDLADLTKQEWFDFLCAFLAGYSEHMRAEVREAPPF